MRMMLATIGLSVLGIALPASAQQFHGDLSGGLSSTAWRVALSGGWTQPVGPRMVFGLGLRATHYGGDASTYSNQGTITAGLPGELAIEPSVSGINLMVSAEVRLTGALRGGINLDLAGLATGSSWQIGAATVTPAHASLFQYGNRDRGSLNSEFFLALPVASHLEVRGGLSHYVTGYTATAGASSTRYLRFEDTPFLAVRWLP